jgi:hypothetical protein
MSISDGLILLSLVFLTGALFMRMIKFELENDQDFHQPIPVRVRRSSWSTPEKRNR